MMDVRLGGQVLIHQPMTKVSTHANTDTHTYTYICIYAHMYAYTRRQTGIQIECAYTYRCASLHRHAKFPFQYRQSLPTTYAYIHMYYDSLFIFHLIQTHNNINIILSSPLLNQVDLTKIIETQSFTFDDAFDCTETNEMMYGRTIAPLVAFLFDGGKASCFAYGQTGSGTFICMCICMCGYVRVD